MKQSRTLSPQGFTLLEMAIVIGIIALVVGMSIQSMKNVVKTAEHTATEIEMQAIENALQAFWQLNGRLPCPAGSESVAKTAVTYGIEAATPGTCTGTRTATGVAEGMVPFITLGLPATLAEDAWKVRYTYAVAPEYTNVNTARRYPQDTACTGLSVLDATANTSNLRTANAMYVLLSHGDNGLGGVLGTGVRNATIGAHADEALNAHSGGMSVFYLARTPEPGSFDDVVSYKTRANINPTEEDMDGLNVDIDQLYVTLSSGADPYVYTYRWTGNAFALQAYGNINTPPTGNMGTIAATGASSCYRYLFLGDAGASAVDSTMHVKSGSTYSLSGSALPTSTDDFNEAAFTAQTDFAAFATEDGPKLQSISTAGAFNTVALTGTAVSTNSTSVAFSPNGRYLAVGAASGEGGVVLYKKNAGGTTYDRASSGQVNVAPTGNVTDVAFSPDGKYLAVTSDAAPFLSIYVVNYSANTFTLVTTTLLAPAGSATSLSFSGNSRLLAVGHDTSPFLTVYSIDVDAIPSLTFNQLSAIETADLPSGTVNDVSFSRRGQFIAAAINSAVGQRSASVYEVRNNKDIALLAVLPSLPTGQNGLAVAFSPN